MNESDTALWMRRLAALSPADELPDPALIWWQARMCERQEARSRAARPLLIAQWGSALVAAAVVLVLFVVYWSGIRDVLAPFAAFIPVLAAGCVAILTGVAWRLAVRE